MVAASPARCGGDATSDMVKRAIDHSQPGLEPSRRLNE